MNNPLQALREAHTLQEKAAATRAIAERAAELREPLSLALTSGDDAFRIDLLSAIGGSRDSSLAEVVEKLVTPGVDPAVLRAAAIALGNLGGPRAFDHLVGLLGHRKPLVRLGAIRGLAILRDARAIAPLSGLLDDTASAPSKWAGAKAGGYVIGTEAAQAIREIRGSDRE